ncbi:MAG: hypothetical protein M3P49_12195 [Actinomycetota bacterium]|nr:hypothetical protein [Actinomycetota bacterium]
MSGRATGNRFGWLSEEEEAQIEEVRREGTPLTKSPAEEPTDLRGGLAHGLPAPVGGGRRRRNRPKNPEALRNDPARMMAGARIRKDVRRRVDQALADPAVSGGAKTNYSLLVEGLLVRWLDEVGYPLDGR